MFVVQSVPPRRQPVGTVHCAADFVTIDIYGSADGHMAQTNNLQPLDVSVIAASMRVVGRLHSPSVVTVAGTVLGSVSADDQVIVSKGGRVEGGVEAREVVLKGEVHGSVVARERLEIQASAVVHGDLHAPRLMVQEGAVVEGVVSMPESNTESPARSGLRSGTASTRSSRWKRIWLGSRRSRSGVRRYGGWWWK